jgi:hypothetical protein
MMGKRRNTVPGALAVLGCLAALAVSAAVPPPAAAGAATKANQACLIAYGKAIEYRRAHPAFSGDPAAIMYGWSQIYQATAAGLRLVGAQAVAAQFARFSTAVRRTAIAMERGSLADVKAAGARETAAARQVRAAAKAARAPACIRLLNVYIG